MDTANPVTHLFPVGLTAAEPIYTSFILLFPSPKAYNYHNSIGGSPLFSANPRLDLPFSSSLFSLSLASIGVFFFRLSISDKRTDYRQTDRLRKTWTIAVPCAPMFWNGWPTVPVGTGRSAPPASLVSASFAKITPVASARPIPTSFSSPRFQLLLLSFSFSGISRLLRLFRLC